MGGSVARATAVAWFLLVLGLCLVGVAIALWNATNPKGRR